MHGEPIAGAVSAIALALHDAAPDGEGTRLFLRPYAAGLLSRDLASPALTCFVLLLLATVTFDGILPNGY